MGSSRMSIQSETAVSELEHGGRTITANYGVAVDGRAGAGNSIKSVIGGKVSIDRFEVVVASGPFGDEVVVLPFAGVAPLPAEFHVSVPGAFRASAAYDSTARFGISDWQTPDDELKAYLRHHKFGADDLPNELKHGLTKVSLEWVMQVFATSTDRSSIVFALGGFGGIGTIKVAHRILQHITPALAQGRSLVPTVPIHVVRYAEIAALAAAGELTQPEPEPGVVQPTLSAADAADGVIAALQPHVGKRVFAGAIDDQKKLDNVLKKVAPGIDPASIVGFIDTGLRASGKAGFVFTADALYLSEIGDRHHLPYETIQSFRLDGDKVRITSNQPDIDDIKILVGTDAAIVIEAMVAATGRQR